MLLVFFVLINTTISQGKFTPEAEKFLKDCYDMKLRINKMSIYHTSIANILNLMAVFYARFGNDYKSLELKLSSLQISNSS